MDQIEYYVGRKKTLEDEIRELEKELKTMPAGTLVYNRTTKNGKDYYSWYNQIEKAGTRTRTSLSKKNCFEEVSNLARKKFIKSLLDDKYNELQCVNYYLCHRKDEKYTAFLNDDSPYYELLCSDNLTKKEWEYLEYNKSNDHPEHLIIPAPKGDLVRSKSEAMIAQVLFSHQIPYRYEEIHDIDGYPIATDFTVLHPKTKAIKLWEHLGLSDQLNYQQTIEFKMIHYLRDGYLPGYDLILTFENKAHPFSYLDAEEVVKKYFL
ncbi:MAG: hypothetical protein IJ260_01590 [Butyrivibrio sp.]|nr:hypothetical protein [Butyrivibrio sp.]MBQ8030221.1 hypothetical protein [Butyrivibrio sp.]MBR1642226.1 hypothetical protein [Butyrivibrio sp.]